MKDMNFRYISEDKRANWRCLDIQCFRKFRWPKKLVYNGHMLKLCPYCGGREIHEKKGNKNDG